MIQRVCYDERMKNIIVSYDKKRGIGAENDLLWLRDLPADLRHFREITMGHAVIMGRRTYESIGKPLPGRQNIVVSQQKEAIDDVTVVGSIEEAFNRVGPGKEAFVIGGGETFRSAIAYIDRIYATEVQAVFPAATIFFPAVDETVWSEVFREKHYADGKNKYDYDFVIYAEK